MIKTRTAGFHGMRLCCHSVQSTSSPTTLNPLNLFPYPLCSDRELRSTLTCGLWHLPTFSLSPLLSLPPPPSLQRPSISISINLRALAFLSPPLLSLPHPPSLQRLSTSIQHQLAGFDIHQPFHHEHSCPFLPHPLQRPSTLININLRALAFSSPALLSLPPPPLTDTEYFDQHQLARFGIFITTTLVPSSPTLFAAIEYLDQHQLVGFDIGWLKKVSLGIFSIIKTTYNINFFTVKITYKVLSLSKF